jgi:phage host-nuclease inhibitor protein Gam
MWQTESKTETFLRKAKAQASQYDVVQNLIQAVDELAREVKRIESEIRRVRREVQTKRRF